MKIKNLLFACAGLLLLAVLGFFLKRTADSRNSLRARGDAGLGLQARVAALPRPALTNLPRLAAAASAVPAAAPTRSTPACLNEETLEPLRRAFVPPRFTEDPGVPRERQTLLSNRLLISPEKRTLPQAASGRQAPTPRNTTPFIVQFNTPVTDVSRKVLSDAGALVRGFFPNNAILAELTPAALAALDSLAPVQAASEYLPTDKLQPFLASLIASQPPETLIRMTVQTLAPEDAEPVSAAIRKAGGEVEGVTAGTRWGTVQAVMPLGTVVALAARGEVQWIEERPLIQRRNDRAASP